VARYALTIFLSAFLLFLVQPLIGKYILPWFGGAPAVWTTCMLFFQVLLLGGYAYAHWLADRAVVRKQTTIHLALLALSLVFLPITPKEFLKPTGAHWPQLQILLLLLVTIGAPYVMLSSTGPLLQSWFSRTHEGRSPYRLYSLSNLGSLLALLSYPFLVEPKVPLRRQAVLWSIAYVAFAALCGWCAVQLRRQGDKETSPSLSASTLNPQPSTLNPKLSDISLWLLLSMAGSVMLLATTNMICQEIAVVPFLWILPLALYLLSFIICFDSPRWYLRWLFLPLLAVAVAAWCLTIGHESLTQVILWTGWFEHSPLPRLEEETRKFIEDYSIVLFGKSPFPWIRKNLGLTIGRPTLWGQIGVYLAVLFACVMTCHGELARCKPQPRHLTLYFLMVSIGGAVGGIFVALIAPYVFPWFWEYQLGVLACCIAVLWSVIRDPDVPAGGDWRAVRWGLLGAACVLLFPLAGVFSLHVREHDRDAQYVNRNFYGVLRVHEEERDLGPVRVLTHGEINHGYQFLDPEMSRWPASYYARDTGISIAARFHPRRLSEDPAQRSLRVGVVGLGAGCIAALGKEGDYFRFYEINPAVVELARESFTYLRDTPAEVDVVLGDGRISLERELQSGGPQRFDILVFDAFSSDAIPIHLLTQECAQMYWQHLRPDGVLALNISNRYVKLRRVTEALAKSLGKEAVVVDSKDDPSIAQESSRWVLITSNRQFLDNPDRKAATWARDEPPRPPLLWTDDFASLWQVIEE
jgi:hypothetical protein